MPRINHVKSYRGKQKCVTCRVKKSEHTTDGHGEFDPGTLNCSACGNPINVGDAYKHASIKTSAYGGYRLTRHEGCATWRPSQLSGNPKTSALLALGEAADDALGQLSEPATFDEAETLFSSTLPGIAQEAAESIMEVVEMYRESSEAIEEGFGHPTWQSEEFEDAASELEYWSDEVSAVDIEEPEEIDDDDEDNDEPFMDWFTTAVDAVTDVLYNNPL
jgi:hypothetical protein